MIEHRPLSDVEKTPLLALRFTASTTTRLQDLVEQRLHHGGFDILNRIVEKNQTILILTFTQKILEQQAERSHVMKRTNDTKVMDAFTCYERARFCDLDEPHRDKYGLFSASERSMIALHMISDITVLPEGKTKTELSQLLESRYHAVTHFHNLVGDEATRSQKVRLRKHGEKSENLKHVLQTCKIVDSVMLIHLSRAVKNEIVRQTFWPLYQLSPPVHLIQSYYGCEVAFYFAWMGFLMRWYTLPGILGFIVFLLQKARGDTVDEDEYIPIYGVFGFVAFILYLRFWDRYEHRLAYQWGTYSLSPYERLKVFALRPEFRGYLRYSPITDEIETFYPAFYRRLKYVLGTVITASMLFVAFVIMILSLNLQGYIRPSANPRRWNDSNPHPFYSPGFAVLAEEGRLFDATSSWRFLIPVAIHVLGINVLNSLYRKVSVALTDWENHETEQNYQNSLILKRFLFEAFDCYVVLFYLAFYERDVERLRMELVSVFQIDTVRRLCMECIIPFGLFRLRMRGKQHVQTDNDTSSIPTANEILEDLEKDEYEQFDDYMEIVIQFGYVTLFASAYPLASLVSIAANLIEMRADCYRMAFLCQRPPSNRSQGMGMWRDLISAIVWMSALTNCLLMGFSSDQLMHYLPQLYERDEVSGYTDMGHERSWIVIFIIFGLERLLLFVGITLHAIIPAVPEDISDLVERDHFIRMQQDALSLARDGGKIHTLSKRITMEKSKPWRSSSTNSRGRDIRKRSIRSKKLS
ncbi:hypothetical protein FisN_23Lh202 [Fistulifera solaris]|uniref:Anoctamin transmembrane domain-containing protein n=1 Tax=Fistulifera solaris TaxID=1519565 RepID=A0A1Z5JRZ5_FISSO|nr:hypothetical protein FisN_23Lh202 [Fistulifera solaris]|eukprot:GAX16666.1 hypothetical protein FisN_23Lh202 [Fistulifera solaris]